MRINVTEVNHTSTKRSHTTAWQIQMLAERSRGTTHKSKVTGQRKTTLLSVIPMGREQKAFSLKELRQRNLKAHSSIELLSKAHLQAQINTYKRKPQ